MFNTVLIFSIFPDAWKMSKILHVPKIPNPGELRDYQPISVLPLLSKALDFFMRDQMIWLIDGNRILSPYVLTNLVFTLVTARPRLFIRLPMTYSVIVTGDW
jgi:hypothetical protein